MRKQPIDSLTEKDKYNFRKYVELYANCSCGPLNIVLAEWNKNKRRLYHAFGNQLQIKKQITIERNTVSIIQDLSSIYTPKIIRSTYDIEYYQNQTPNDDFISDFTFFIACNDNLKVKEKKNISRLFSYQNIVEGCLNGLYEDNMKLENYNFTCKNGMKTMRTIQKCLKALKYSNMDKFYKWRDKINLIDRNTNSTVTLVLSINPIDFITMSDNKCNWSSCMSWINDGCYHAGTIEMMNSNLAAVAYLENSHNFLIKLDENNILDMSNKSWRELLFVNKNIIIAGKSYPYYNEDLSIKALTFMRELVENKFHWSYTFINQKYRDLTQYDSNYFLKYIADPQKSATSKKHFKIFTYTNGMYHDMVEDVGTPYWCCRNKPKKGLRLNLSGSVTCMCCGEKIYEDHDIYNADDIGREKICYDCKSSRCPICGKITYLKKYYFGHSFCSEECAREGVAFEGQNIIIPRSEFLSNSNVTFLLVAKNQKLQQKIYNIIFDTLITFKMLTPGKRENLIKIRTCLLDKGYICGRDYIIQKVPIICIDRGLVSMYSRSTDRLLLGQPKKYKDRLLYTSYLSSITLKNYKGYYQKNERIFTTMNNIKKINRPFYLKDLIDEGRGNENINSLIDR